MPAAQFLVGGVDAGLIHLGGEIAELLGVFLRGLGNLLETTDGGALLAEWRGWRTPADSAGRTRRANGRRYHDGAFKSVRVAAIEV
ncbi:MAG TPA: hypothetical protein VKE74_30665 [Gemmataceae bacterium]|nr:hypothetical protein [Gemmataceae bacterium]